MRKAAFKTLRGLPRYVTHNIHLSFFYNYDENLLVPGMDYSGVCCGLRGRLSWYKCRLGLRVKRLALYWYALPYRPSGPGHARDVEAWDRMNETQDQRIAAATQKRHNETVEDDAKTQQNNWDVLTGNTKRQRN